MVLPDVLDLENDDIVLHAVVGRLLMLAAFDQKTYRKVALELLSDESQLITSHSASDWAWHISGSAHEMGSDTRFLLAAVLARKTGQPEILHTFLDVEIKSALGQIKGRTGPDLSRLRQIHAAMKAAQLRPLLKVAMGNPRDQKLLEVQSARVREAIQDWCKTVLAPTQKEQHFTSTTGRSILLTLSWLPADPEKGAHLKQIVSYTCGLIEASRANGQPPARVRLILTYDDATTWLPQNFQSYSPKSMSIIEDAVKSGLGPELAECFSTGHFLPQKFDTSEAWLHAIMSDVEEFNPDAVIRWYGFYATNAIAPALHARFPVVGIQFNATNSVDSFADLLLSHGILDSDRAASDARWRRHRLPLEVLPRRLEFSREELELPEGAFTMVSALTGGRLERSVSRLAEKELLELLRLFDDKPNLIWLLVGVQNQEVIRAVNPILATLIDSGRIICIGFTDDLRALYRHCDLYVHLPRMDGGGMGVAMAVAENIAVICHAGSDPCNFLPENTIPENWNEFSVQLHQLIDGADARNEVAKDQLDWLNIHHSLIGVGQEVLEFVDAAIKMRRENTSETGGVI